MSWANDVRRLLATRSDRIVTLVSAVLLVLVGYVAGLWTAETRKEVPIVFQTSSGDADDGILSDEDVKKLAPPKGSDMSAVSTKSPPSAVVKSEEAFVASINGTKYYVPGCSEVRRIKEENRVWFASEQEARDANYEPSACVQRERETR